MTRHVIPPNAILGGRSRLCQGVLARVARLRCLPRPRAYSLTVSHGHKFIWFRVPKNGTRTVLRHLESSGVTLDVAERPYSLYYAPALYPDYFKFAFVRNPWDRLVSCWVDKVVKKKGVLFGLSPGEVERMMRFDQFVEYVSTLDVTRCNYHLRSQCAMIDLDGVDYLGRLERFEVDWRRICQTAGVPCGAVAHKNKGRRNNYRDYYTPQLQARVREIYRKDVQVFGYEF